MRILIGTVTAGAGHLAAAAALDEAWRTLRPGDTIEKLDLSKLFSPLHRKVVSDGYVTLVEKAPELWGMMFKKTDDTRLTRRMNRIKQMFPSRSRQKFMRHLKQFQPDVVLCTHYLPLETLGQLRRREIRKGKQTGHSTSRDGARTALSTPPIHCDPKPFVVSIVTDFEAHALWMDHCVDLYCIAAEETKARLVARGADKGSVLATGIPISGRFSLKTDQKAVRERMGLRDDQPVLLVLSGGFGMGPVAEILSALDDVPHSFQTVVVTGRNEELRRQLAAADRKHPTHILGFASNMHELMAISDLIISKPGGLTSSEALALGKPLFVLNPIPGQEAANSDFLLERGAALKVNRVEDLPFRLDQLFSGKKLSQLSRAAKALGRPNAAMDICREVLKRAEANSH